MAERWMRPSVDMVKHVPWRTSEGDPKADGEKPEVIKLNPEQEHVEREIMKDAAPRRAYITKEDLNELGYTAKCPGCLAILRGTARQGHSADCRKRVEGLLADSTKVIDSTKRMKEFAEKVVGLEEGKRRKEDDAKEVNPRAMASGSTTSLQESEDSKKAQQEREVEKRKREQGGDEENAERLERGVDVHEQERGAPKRKAEDDSMVEAVTDSMVMVNGLEVNQEEEEGWRGEDVHCDNKTDIS